MAINNVMGEAERLVLNATEGAGFIGIAVALMGRSHPLGVFLAAILFGFLYQGGAELAFWTTIPRELIVVIQALVILFTGALDNMVRMPLERLFLRMPPAAQARPAQGPDGGRRNDGERDVRAHDPALPSRRQVDRPSEGDDTRLDRSSLRERRFCLQRPDQPR